MILYQDINTRIFLDLAYDKYTEFRSDKIPDTNPISPLYPGK